MIRQNWNEGFTSAQPILIDQDCRVQAFFWVFKVVRIWQNAGGKGLSGRKSVGTFAGIGETMLSIVRRRLQWAPT